MADLERTRRRERGQIILIAALALAVTFVALAVVVNSAIYTENLASRGETGGSEKALELRYEIDRGVAETVRYANVHNSTDPGTLDAAVSSGTRNVTAVMERQQASNGAYVNVTQRSTVHGSRIAQNDSSEFTSSGGSADWVVVEDVERETSTTNGTRAFEIEATPLSTTPFRVVVEEWSPGATGDTWVMELSATAGGDVVVDVQTGSGDSESCSIADPGRPVHVDVTRGTVDGVPCDALQRGDEDYRFGSGVGDRYNVSFENGDQVEGNYSLVTTNTSIDQSNNLYPGVGSSSPYGDDAIYSVHLEYAYHSPRTTYETGIRVARGEPR